MAKKKERVKQQNLRKDCKTCRRVKNLKKLKDKRAALSSQINDLESNLHEDHHKAVKEILSKITKGASQTNLKNLQDGPGEVSPQITDSITQANVKVLGEIEARQKEIEDRFKSLEEFVQRLAATLQQLIKKLKKS